MPPFPPDDGGDTPPPAPDGAPPADPPPSDPPPPAGAETEVPPSGETETPSADDSVFDRAYVEKLRNEAAENRVKRNEFEQSLGRYTSVFDGVDDATVDAILALNGKLLSDPDKAGPLELIRTAKALLGDRFEDVLKESDAPQYLTAEEAERKFQSTLEQREKAQREADQLAAVQREATELGYADGTVENSMLFWFAVNETETDLKAAHEKVQAFKQNVIDTFVAEQKKINDGYPPQANSGGAPSDQAEAPKTLAEARAAMERRMAAVGAGPG